MDETELDEGKEITAESHEEFLKSFASKKLQSKPPVHDDNGSSVASSFGSAVQHTIEAGKANDEKTKIALLSLRKQHNAWELSRRTFSALVAKSQGNENTSGSKCEMDLGSLIVQGDKFDAVLLKLEQKVLQGQSFTDEEILEIATTVNGLKDATKKGGKTSSALRTWFKLD